MVALGRHFFFFLGEKKKCEKAKWLSEEALQVALKRDAKGKGEKERYYHMNA